jgi:hypothetical protein
LRQQVKDLLKKRPAGVMSYSEFMAEAGMAKIHLANPEQLARMTPEAVDAAKAWERHLYEPLGKAADEVQIYAVGIRRALTKTNKKALKTSDPPKRALLVEKAARLEKRLAKVEKGVHRPNFLNRIYNQKAVRERGDELKALIMQYEGVTAQQADDIIKRIRKDTPFVPVDDQAIGEAAASHLRGLAAIPDAVLAERGFISTDIGDLGDVYARTMGTDVELTRAFGSADMADHIAAIEADYARLIFKATTPEAKAALAADQAVSLRDVRAIRDQLRGTYALPADPERLVSRAIRFTKYFNTLTQLTGALGAIVDLARPIMTEGLTRSFRTGFVPYFKSLNAARLARAELNLHGEALEMVLSTRAAMFTDLPEIMSSASGFEHLAGRAAHASFIVNLLNQWTDAIKTVNGLVISTRILEDVTKWTEGIAAGKASRQAATPSAPTVPFSKAVTGTPATVHVYRGSGGGGKVSFDELAGGEGAYWAPSADIARLFGKNVQEALVTLKNPAVLRTDADLIELFRAAGVANPEALTNESIAKTFADARQVYLKGNPAPFPPSGEKYAAYEAKAIAFYADQKVVLETAMKAQKAAWEQAMELIRKRGHDGIIVDIGRSTKETAKFARGTDDAIWKEMLNKLMAGKGDPILVSRFSHDQVIDFSKSGHSPAPASAGTASTLEAGAIMRLARAHIDAEMAERIAKQAATHGTREGEVWHPNTGAWTDRLAAETFGAALTKDVNISIVTPAPGERALWTSTEWGSLIAQFKGFAQASGNRVLVAGLQNRDQNFYTGALMLVGAGAMLDHIRRLQRGDHRPQSFTEQLTRAIDRSGILGYFTDAGKIAQSAIDPASSFGSFLTDLAGPTGTTAANVYGAMFGPTNLRGRAVLRLAPFNHVLGVGDIFGRIIGLSPTAYDTPTIDTPALTENAPVSP